jgi:hypothetical protein
MVNMPKDSQLAKVKQGAKIIARKLVRDIALVVLGCMAVGILVGALTSWTLGFVIFVLGVPGGVKYCFTRNP